MRVSAIPGHFLTLRNGHQFVATARRLGMRERYARGLGKALQLARSPREYMLRRQLARQILCEVTPPFVIRDGYVRFLAGDLPSGQEAVATCQRIAEEEKAGYSPQPGEKGFLRTLLMPDRLREYPELLGFATSRQMIAVLAEYLGTVPILSDLRLWWSVPSATPEAPTSSQNFHRDHEDFRQVKVFVNVQEVTEDAGPFTFLPATVSNEVASKLRSPFGRIEDSEILAHAGPDQLIALTGAPGEAAMVDTCSCFHYGSRNETRERMVLMVHYVGYHSIFETDRKVLTDEVRADWVRDERVLAALMRVRPTGL